MTLSPPPPRAAVADQILVFYGSYRTDRLGIRLADFIVSGFRARGESVELIDAKAVGLPMLDRMYKEYPPGGVVREVGLGGSALTPDEEKARNEVKNELF